ncbi:MULTISPECIES: dTMP kinase [Actinomycetes]|uniref:Thymidylate kinase n=5 Tax=Actinomycetes TaxID=1760 RepID=A0A8E1W5J0_9PSEU|nr:MULTISPECIES: AAA family ATPase [Actinomycetes]PXY18188.1 thymidylate kinase [Prauserella coralliicola]PXY25757.1 thymidylate kinase [Prauserella flavalba]RBM22394.1 thymidylate kinase [Prauserella sp. PE36]AXB46101.1 thymidylate kinase [Amycolatopsis albispora]MBB2504057.1 AAA family ATPase [Amycolatopsis echigonensis]
MTNAAPLFNPARGREITVVGIDGAGKSTLATRLHQALNEAGHETILIGKHSTEVPMDAELSAYVDRLNALVYRRDARVAQACGDHYWLLALAAWYTLQDKLVIQPALAAGTHVILDNAHHKILARYAVNPDVSTSLAEQVFAHLTEPDLVFFLRISARDALARKGEFSSLETGHSGGADEDFIRYQDTVLAKLREHEQRGGWLSMDVTDMDRDAVFKTAAEALADRLQLAI